MYILHRQIEQAQRSLGSVFHIFYSCTVSRKHLTVRLRNFWHTGIPAYRHTDINYNAKKIFKTELNLLN